MPSSKRCRAISGIVLLILVIAFSLFLWKLRNSAPRDEKRTIKFKQSNREVLIYKEYTEKRIVMWLLKDGISVGPSVELGTFYAWKQPEFIQIENGYCLKVEDVHEIRITIDVDTDEFSSVYVKQKFKGKIEATSARTGLTLFSDATVTTCISTSKWRDIFDLNWYGGPQQEVQKYPIQNMELADFPYITSRMNRASIVERYWLASDGFFIFFDYDTPLFLDQNQKWESENGICFTAEQRLPYNTHSKGFNYNFKVGFGNDAKVTHLNVINRELGKPQIRPSVKMVRQPIWNTRVRYGKDVDATSVASYAHEIASHGFNHSLLVIDDSWETCYGSMTFHQKFSNIKSLIDDLKSNGFSIGLWVHPFIDIGCEPFYSEAKTLNYLVKSYSGNMFFAWWNSGTNLSTHIDFTNIDAHNWFHNRLVGLRDNYGIDAFRFDGAESDLQPEDPFLQGEQALSPSLNTLKYLELATDFGEMAEVRTGWKSQKINGWTRMREFDSKWSEDNGLKSLIPTLLQMNMNGYVFVMPDTIGGNQQNFDGHLFIRWLQASVFMPSLQFSMSPWDFDDEIEDISRKFIKLHQEYAELIAERFLLAIKNGDPVNPPIWWLDPNDVEALKIEDEFLLGETILVAPIVEANSYLRDIYLPKGTWKDGNSEKIYEGENWLRNYAAALDVLPYFIRQS